MKAILTHILSLAAILAPVPACPGQTPDSLAVQVVQADSSAVRDSLMVPSLLAKADSLRMVYDFGASVETYLDAMDLVSDSTMLITIDEAMGLSQNGENMAGFCDQPVVVARQKMPVKDFFLFYPLEDRSWRPVPNQLDSLGDGPYAQAMYIPEACDDLYYSATDENGIRNIYHTSLADTVWTVPSLLNEQLTSSSDEIYPMLSPDGESLYFASKGLYGMGGYDLYVSTWNRDTREWDIPVNLGFPYSSPSDDFLFVNTPDGRYSLFASNRGCSADSIYIYVLEYDAMPVRKAVHDPAELRALAGLSPVDDPSRMDNGSAAGDIAGNVDTRRYTDRMTKVRALRDSISAYGNSIDEARSRLSLAEGEERDRLSSWILERELALPVLQDSLSLAVKELQEVEMEFLMSGVVIDPDKLRQEADREVIGASSAYVFSKMSMGGPVEMNVLKPKPSFDYSLMVLPEGRFAEDNTLPEGLVYQIQIFSSSSEPTVDRLKGLSPVFWRMTSPQKYTCYAGLFRTYKDVLGNLNKVKRAGFKSAFIVAFNDGKTVSVTQARQMEKSIRPLYQIRIYPADGKALSETAMTAVQALTSQDIARASEGGIVSYLVGPFDDRGEAETIVSGLKAAGLQSVSIESAGFSKAE